MEKKDAVINPEEEGFGGERPEDDEAGIALVDEAFNLDTNQVEEVNGRSCAYNPDTERYELAERNELCMNKNGEITPQRCFAKFFINEDKARYEFNGEMEIFDSKAKTFKPAILKDFIKDEVAVRAYIPQGMEVRVSKGFAAKEIERRQEAQGPVRY